MPREHFHVTDRAYHRAFAATLKDPVAKVWNFASSSGRGSYEMLLFTNGSVSCNCPGWTRRVDAHGNRSCKHTRSFDMGRADLECESSHDYAAVVAKPAASASPEDTGHPLSRTPPPRSLRKDEAKRAGVAFGMSARKLA